jgi:hypothetical protein
MKVRAVHKVTVDGTEYAKGDEFQMTNSRAAYDAQEAGHVKIIEGEEPLIEGFPPATPKLRGKGEK